MSEESQTQRIARQKRTELLEGAVEELAHNGWRGLRMQAIAERVGVSRQTVYNTFSDRDGLASALVTHLTESFLDGFDSAFATADGSIQRWNAGIQYLLRRGADDPALRAMLGVDAGEHILGLLTSGSAPIVVAARHRVSQTVLTLQPDLDPTLVEQATEILARLTLSNIVQQMDDVERATEAITTMVTRFLGLETHAALQDIEG